MDTFGNDLSYGGQVLSKSELISRRERNGECTTCGQKCFNKKLFKMVPITIPGVVLEGRCLACNPQDPSKEVVTAAVAAVAPSKKSSSKRRARGGKDSSASVRSNISGSTRSGVGSSSRSVLNRSHSSSSEHGSASTRNNALRVAATAVIATNNARSRSRLSIEEDIEDDDDSDASDLNDPPPQRGQLQVHQQSSSRQEQFTRGASRRPSEILFGGINLDDLTDEIDSSPALEPDAGESKRPSIIERKALAAIHNPNNTALDILNIMMTNSTSAVIQNDGLHALSLTLRNPTQSLLNDIQSGCGYELIVSAMGKCAGDSMAQTNACKVLFLAGAAGDEEHQTAIGLAGGLEALADAIRDFQDDMIVLEGCLLALSNLCIPEENLNYVIEGKLIEAVVGVMSSSVENCGLQEHGCAVLANLSLHDRARKYIRDAGGCDTIVVSMVVNPMDVEVQSQALVALRNLCAKDEENRVLLASAGAIDAVIGAMQCHRNDAKIQERGSWVLSILGSNDDNKLYIGDNGGIDVLVRSMCVHPDDAGVQEKALRALWTLSVEKELRFPIVEVNTISATVAAMQAHSEDAAVQEKGCGVLTNLAATSTKLKVQIVKEGSLETAVMAMILHGENEILTERAVSLIKKLCIVENAEAMLAANVAPIMTMVVETFPSSREKANMILNFLGEGDGD